MLELEDIKDGLSPLQNFKFAAMLSTNSDKYIEQLFYDFDIITIDDIGPLIDIIEIYRPQLYKELTEDTFISKKL